MKGTVTEDYQGILVHDHEKAFFKFQSMLNVPADGGINVFSCTFVIPKGNLFKGGIRIVKVHIL